MQRGKVKWFDDRKGFGFIDSPEGDVFVHFRSIDQPGYKTLTDGQVVEYTVERTEKGLSAQNVRPVADAPAPAAPAAPARTASPAPMAGSGNRERSRRPAETAGKSWY